MTTDYKQREVHRLAYVLWIENSERRAHARPTPESAANAERTPSKRTIRANILAHL